MDVLSFFDGIACLREALKRANISVSSYYAAEISKPSIRVAQKNHSDIIQLGDVNNIHFTNHGMEVDESGSSMRCIGKPFRLIAGGSPCQDISNLNKKKEGLKGKKSSLFYKFLEAKEHYKDAYFLLENVSGTDTKIITKELKVRPIKLDSQWVIPQTRNRYYWTNIPVNSLPKRTTLTLQDILEENVDDRYYQTEAWNTWWLANRDFQLDKSYSTLNAKKAGCLTARMYASWNGNFIQDERGIRRLTPIECERLQTLPDNYTEGIRESERYKALGDCWTVDIITHILKHIPENKRM